MERALLESVESGSARNSPEMKETKGRPLDTKEEKDNEGGGKNLLPISKVNIKRKIWKKGPESQETEARLAQGPSRKKK